MDALNFLKFWRSAAMTTTTTSTSFPHLVVETDSESDEEDSFFDLELTLHDFENKENTTSSNKTSQDPQNQTSSEAKALCSKHEVKSKTATAEDSAVHASTKTEHSLSPKEPISNSKRKVLPIDPISKPQSPIAILKSAPSFRIFMFKKHKRISTEKTEEPLRTECNMGRNQKENKVFALKLGFEEDFQCYSSPVLSRVNSTRSFGSKVRNNSSEEPKQERFSKEALQKYLKLIKPLYVRVSKGYSEKMKETASPSSSPAASFVRSRKEKQGGFTAGMKGVSRHLGKSRSSLAAVGVGSPMNWSDDTLLQQHDGIQSAILHCKRSLNSRDSSIALCEETSMHSLRNSFAGYQGSIV